MHTNVIILNTLFGISQGLYYIFIARHNKSSTTLHRSMTSSTQALSLLCEMLACLLVQCPSKFLSPLRIQFKVMQKMPALFLSTSKRALKLSLSTLRRGKMSRLYSFTSSGFLHLRAHSSFCLVLLYFLRMVKGVFFVPRRKSVMKYTHSNSAFSFSLYSLFLTLE